jgi:phage-related protein
LAGRPIAYKGRAFTIAYVVDRNGRSPGKEFFDALPREDQAKVMSLFGRLGDYGSISNPEKFRKLEGNCYEFKSFQIRMPCFFLPAGLVLITHGFRKKRDRTPREEIERAKRIFEEDQERERRSSPQGCDP